MLSKHKLQLVLVEEKEAEDGLISEEEEEIHSEEKEAAHQTQVEEAETNTVVKIQARISQQHKGMINLKLNVFTVRNMGTMQMSVGKSSTVLANKMQIS